MFRKMSFSKCCTDISDIALVRDFTMAITAVVLVLPRSFASGRMIDVAMKMQAGEQGAKKLGYAFGRNEVWERGDCHYHQRWSDGIGGRAYGSRTRVDMSEQ